MFEQLQIVLCRDDGRKHEAGEPGIMIQSSVVSDPDDIATGLAISAALAPDKPLFAAQHGFLSSGGVQLRLPAINTSYMAVYQHKDWWLRPAFPQDASAIPARTQLLLWQADDKYHVLVALCGSDYRADIQGEKDQLLVALSSNQSGMMTCRTPALSYASDSDPFIACEHAVLYGLRLTGHGQARVRKQYPFIFNQLGFCTWDAFYHKVDALGIDTKLEEFKTKNIPVSWVLIDDGWSQADYEKQELQGLDAVDTKFPGGLQQTISFIKASYGVRYVGVWQAAMGYWNGIASDSQAYHELQKYMVALPDGRHVPDPEHSFNFWHTWHSHLARQGVDFVKIDQQSAPSLFFRDRHSYGEASQETQSGIGASTALHFNGNAIHCMGMAPEDLWTRSTAALIRSSDDFVPDAPNGFIEHCKQNVYNALLFSPLYWGDCDMFWSTHSNSIQHAMLRAVSGGPVYISDKIDQTDPAVIWPLLSSDGTVYRCDSVALPTADCLLEDPARSNQALKIWNTCRNSYIIGAFSSTETHSSSGTIRLNDISKALKGAYLCVSMAESRAEIVNADSVFHFILAAGQSAIFLLVPLHQNCTAIGLIDKFISPATIDKLFYHDNSCQIILKESGKLAFHMGCKPSRVMAGTEDPLPILSSGDLQIVDVPGQTLTIYWDSADALQPDGNRAS